LRQAYSSNPQDKVLAIAKLKLADFEKQERSNEAAVEFSPVCVMQLEEPDLKIKRVADAGRKAKVETLKFKLEV
jgi:hypothetical protein